MLSAGRTPDAIAHVLRAVAKDTRLRVLGALMGRELCVCELVDALSRPHYAVSRDLAALQRVGFVRERREGSWVYHSIAPDVRSDALRSGVLQLVARTLESSPAAKADRERLAQRLALRAGDRCVVAVADVGRAARPG